MVQHTQIQIAQAIIAQAKLRLRRRSRAVPEPLPRPDIEFGLLPGAEQFWFNIQFDIPVLNRNQGGIRAARATCPRRGEIDDSPVQPVEPSPQLDRQYRAAREVVRKFESVLLPNSQKLLRLAQDGYSKGLTDFSTFLQFRRSRVQVNSDYLDALTNLWINAAQLSGLFPLEKFR